MAQTSTHISADDCVITLDNESGTPTDISGSSNTIEINIETPVNTGNTFEGSSPLSWVGKDQTNISLVVWYSTTTGEGLDILKQWKFGSNRATARSIQIDIPDSSSGSDRYYGEVNLGNLAIPMNADGGTGVQVTADLTNDGAFSWTVIT